MAAALNKHLRRVASLCRAAALDKTRVIDWLELAADERHLRRVVLTGRGGTRFLLDLPQATALHDGDGLLLDDGSIVGVAGKRESLVEITTDSPQQLARFAWQIGNRHTDIQVIGDRLRIRRDHVLEEMLRGLGAKLTAIEAVFEPEPGAYAHQHHHHGDES
jgi:urease accessory protein